MFAKVNLLSHFIATAALFYGAAVAGFGQGTLPDYVIVRLQTAPDLSFGTFPGQAVVVNGTVYLQGVGWDTVNARTTGTFISAYDGLGVRTLFMDTVGIRSLNDPDKGSAMVVADGNAFSTIRLTNYKPTDTTYVTSGAAAILEATHTKSGVSTVSQVDTFWYTPQEVDTMTWYMVAGVRDLHRGLVQRSGDTIRYCLTSAWRNANRKSRVELRSYVADDSLGLRLVKRLPITAGVASGEFQLAAWSSQDTLGRILSKASGNRFALVAEYRDMHTGQRLPPPEGGSDQVLVTAADNPGDANAVIVASQGIVLLSAVEVIEPRPDELEGQPIVWAFDLSTGRALWTRRYRRTAGWPMRQILAESRVDSAGRTAVTYFNEYRVTSVTPYEEEVRVQLRGTDMLTGDSLWATTLRLDSAATPGHDIRVVDVAMRPGGQGFVAAALVSDSRLDPNRDLRYAYTALFFLDSLGCLAPGCRESSSTSAPGVGYEIRLSPNPAPVGSEVEVRLPEAYARVRYALTDAQGRTLLEGEDAPTDGRLRLALPLSLVAGLHYVTVWPTDGGAAVLTQAVVVQ